MEIKIKYFGEFPEKWKVEKIEKGDWIDLRTAEDVEMFLFDYHKIKLGVGMILPEGYEALVVPRSSTFQKWGIIMANGMGVIDNSYSGNDDKWHFPAIAFKTTFIPRGTRIAQFRIQKKMEDVKFVEVSKLNDISRGGFGSTGSM